MEGLLAHRLGAAIVFSFLFASSSSAQVTETQPAKNENPSGSIEIELPKPPVEKQGLYGLGVGISTYAEIPVTTFELSSEPFVKSGDDTKKPADPRQTIQYQPSFALNRGLRLSWKGLGLSHASRWTIEDPATIKKYGNTEFENWRFNLAMKDVAIDMFYQNFHGFYTDTRLPEPAGSAGPTVKPANSGSISYEPDGTVHRRDDVRTEQFGASIYAGQKLFGNYDAFQSAFGSLVRAQEPFSVDLVVGAFHNRFRMEADGPLIPFERKDKFTLGANGFTGTRMSTTGLGVGAAVGAGGGNHYFSMLMFLGGGLQAQEAHYGTQVEDDYGFGSNVAFKLKYTRTGEVMNWGFALNYDSVNSSIGDFYFRNSNMGLLFSLGMKI